MLELPQIWQWYPLQMGSVHVLYAFIIVGVISYSLLQDTLEFILDFSLP